MGQKQRFSRPRPRPRGQVLADGRPGSTDYVLGSQRLTPAGRTLNRLDIARLAQHPRQQLHAYSGETVFLSARQGAYLTNLAVFEYALLNNLPMQGRPDAGQRDRAA